MSIYRIVFLFVVAVLYSSVYAGNNWPRFRGPTAMGVAEDDSRLPDRWSRTENVVWQAEVPGWGWSCPVVWGSKVFLTTVVGEEEYGRNRFTPRASFAASPWAYNGKLFFLSENGVTYVVEAGSEFKQLHTNSLDELCFASPAACQGKLLIRTASRIYCFSNSISGMDKERR